MTEMMPDHGDSSSFSEHTGRRQRHTHIWGSEIPFRNPHFTGRETNRGHSVLT